MTDGRTDGQTDGRTDGGDCNIPIAFLKKRGDNNFSTSDDILMKLRIITLVIFTQYKFHEIPPFVC